ncbi:MAG TPA: hypothetical protein ENI57_01590 [Ignavibacteria bacterium]|nr:hypothetical protein [Ignavibacteria bacterium]
MHWLIEELQKIGINEIKVTQYFKSHSQISLLELKCDNNFVKEVRKLIHEVGTTGNAVDHYITVKDLSQSDGYPDSNEDSFHQNILN